MTSLYHCATQVRFSNDLFINNINLSLESKKRKSLKIYYSQWLFPWQRFVLILLRMRHGGQHCIKAIKQTFFNAIYSKYNSRL